ncbi:MAG: hypothetical protein JO168_07935 [Solirubrobacterales bacterium]|nr:hypothetical protein [Solirubrobacterales bacterium]
MASDLIDVETERGPSVAAGALLRPSGLVTGEPDSPCRSPGSVGVDLLSRRLAASGT